MLKGNASIKMVLAACSPGTYLRYKDGYYFVKCVFWFKQGAPL